MSNSKSPKINAIRMLEEGACRQLVYDTHVAQFSEYGVDYIIPYILELLETPVVCRRAAHAMLMWVNYQWEDIAYAIGKSWPVLDGKPNEYALLFTYKIVNLMIVFDLKPWWYAHLLGRETSIIGYPWMVGELQTGVEWTDYLRVMTAEVSYEDWSRVYHPIEITEVVEECLPEAVEPLVVILRDKCNIIAEYPVEREEAVAYQVEEFYRNVDTQDEILRSVIAKILVQFYNNVLQAVEHCLIYSSLKQEDISRACYKFMDRLRSTSVDDVHIEFHAYHLRLMHYVNEIIGSLITSRETGMQVLGRIMWHILTTSPNPLHRDLDISVSLHVMITQPLPANVVAPDKCYQEDVTRHGITMRSLLPNRNGRVYILSRNFIQEIVEKIIPNDPEFIRRLAQLSLCARLLLTPDGDPGRAHVWGEGTAGTLQLHIPWLQIAPSGLTPERYLCSRQDVALYLYRILRLSPLNMSLQRVVTGGEPIILPILGDFSVNVGFDVMDVDPPDEIQSIRRDIPPEADVVFAPVETRKALIADPVTDCNLYAQANRLTVREVESYNKDPSQPHNPIWCVVMAMYSAKVRIEGRGEGHNKKLAKAAACAGLLAQLPRDWNG